MKLVEGVERMQLICRRLICEERKTIRLVPTMGSLHAGHASLIKRAIEDSDHDGGVTSALEHPNGTAVVVVVSIFVNPLQFNDVNDFANYPEAREQDLATCEELGVDYVFMPKCADILQAGGGPLLASRCTVKPPDELARDLEGGSRRDHFEGMLTIVCKLINIVQPSRAYFGEKDYQQLVLVDKMVKDLSLPVSIRPVASVRESETNLPLSSRNVRLTSDQRRLAASLMYGTLLSARNSLETRARLSSLDDASGERPASLNTILLSSLLAAQCLLPPGCALRISGHPVRGDEEAQETLTIDYLELRCAKDLTVIRFDQESGLYDCKQGCVRERLDESECPVVTLSARLLIAIVIANVRLLDNLEVRLNL